MTHSVSAEGAQVHYLFQVAKGSVRIEKRGQVLATLTGASVFGEVTFVSLSLSVSLSLCVCVCERVCVYL